MAREANDEGTIDLRERRSAGDHADELLDRGFTVVPNVISEPLIGRLKEAIDRALADELEAFGDRAAKIPHLVVELVQYDDVFLEVLENEVMLDLFEAVLGPDCILYCFNTAVMPPHQAITSTGIHTDQNFFIPGYCARALMTLALDDFTEENGATYHMPYSQHLPEPPDETTFYAEAQRMVRSAGDAVFFNCRNWHAGAVNHTDSMRYALGVQAARPFLKQRYDYAGTATPELVEKLSPRARRFLGLFSTPPTSLDEFYRPPEERSYRPYAGRL